MAGKLLAIVPGLIGGIVGGILGILIFEWGVRQGFYALVIPGALVGLLCGVCSPVDSSIRGALCAVLALSAGLIAEWRSFPFKADPGFPYFLGHVGELKMMTLLMIALAGFLGFWWGRERILPGRGKPKNSGNGLNDSVL